MALITPLTPFKRVLSGDVGERAPLLLHNTLSQQEEAFEALSGQTVRMYNCGPTVYNYAHIGNLRAYVFADILRRTLEANGYEVSQVINITDVGHLTSDADEGEDRVEAGAKREHKSAKEITEFYTKAFFEDLVELNIRTDGTRFPRATDYIEEQISLIKRLEENDFTYKTSDGVYFDSLKFKNYGKLGNINLSGLKEGARVEKNIEKKNSTDFALWKFSSTEEKRQQEWQSPWGVGFPGWHIECSAMSMKLLGETFDIHTGGIDHIPIHHNDEIAQSEAATGKPFVHYWLHNAFVTIEGEKMAKSKENFIRLATLKEKGISPLAYRYFLLTANYRTPVTFSFEALKGAEHALQNLYRELSSLPLGGEVSISHVLQFLRFVNKDLGTPQALAYVFDVLKSELSPEEKLATILIFDEILGLKLASGRGQHATMRIEEIPIAVKNLVTEREIARKNEDWKRADALREEISHSGFSVEDTDEGPRVSKR